MANEVLRAGLRFGLERSNVPPYRPPTFDPGRPLVDMTNVAQTLQVLERRD